MLGITGGWSRAVLSAMGVARLVSRLHPVRALGQRGSHWPLPPVRHCDPERSADSEEAVMARGAFLICRFGEFVQFVAQRSVIGGAA